jgi:hypothetical protein
MQTGALYADKSINLPKKLNTTIVYEPKGRAREYSEGISKFYWPLASHRHLYPLIILTSG